MTATIRPALALVEHASDGVLPVHLVAEGAEPDAGPGALARQLGLSGRAGESMMAMVDGAPSLLVGVGPVDRLDAEAMRLLGARIAREAKRPRIAIHGLAAMARPGLLDAFADGVLSAAYRFGRYHTMRPAPDPVEGVEIVADGHAPTTRRLAAELERTVQAAPARVIARDLVNEAPSTLTPRAFAEAARVLASEVGLDIEVLDEVALADARCGGILGIGRGSAEPPRLVVLSTRTEDPRATVALVGKGITFDAGGLFVKRPEGMATMKGDMAGAAAILGAMGVVGTCAPRVRVRAYLALAENLPGERAIKPGDVVTARNGKTIEVNDPDAEGRVVLADALSMASEAAPDAIVDLATLTDSKQVSVGNRYGGLFSDDDALVGRLVAAGAKAGEPLWRLPIIDAYRPRMDSPVADLRTYDPSPSCPDAIHAALFLREFVGPGIPWAHLDIAGCEFAGRDADVPEGMATGFGARLLVELLRSYGNGAVEP